jgi:hypothetical protein
VRTKAKKTHGLGIQRKILINIKTTTTTTTTTKHK